MTPEHRVMNEIRLWCGNHDILCFRTNVGKVKLATGGYFDTGLPTGFPDLLILPGEGLIIFCEVKSAVGRQRPEQIEFEKLVKKRGYKYIISHSLEEFISQINYMNLVQTHIMS